MVEVRENCSYGFLLEKTWRERAKLDESVRLQTSFARRARYRLIRLVLKTSAPCGAELKSCLETCFYRTHVLLLFIRSEYEKSLFETACCQAILQCYLVCFRAYSENKDAFRPFLVEHVFAFYLIFRSSHLVV